MISNLLGVLKSVDNHKKMLFTLAILLPLEYIPSFEVYGLRLRLSFFVGGLIIVSAIIVRFSRAKKFNFSLSEWLIVAWLIWLMIRAIGADDKKAMLNVVLPLMFYVLLALSIKIIIKKDYIKSVLKGLFIGAGLAISFGFYQFLANWLGVSHWLTGLRPQYSWESFGFPRLQSTALEPLYFSAYLLLPFAILLSFMVRSNDYRKPIYLVLLFSILVADILTLSRGGLVALVVELMVIGIFYISRINVKSLIYIICSFIGVVIIVFGLISLTARQGRDSDVTYGQKGVNTLVSHLKNFSFFANSNNKANDDSVGQRDRARVQAKTTITDNKMVLFFGVGPGQYQNYNQTKYKNPDLGEPNNLVLEQTVQFGLVGVVLFFIAGLSMLIGLFNKVKNKSWQISALCIGLIAYFIALFLQAQTFTGLALTHLWFAVGLALFLVQYQSEKANKNEKT